MEKSVIFLDKNDLKQTLDSDWANDNDSSLSTKLP